MIQLDNNWETRAVTMPEHVAMRGDNESQCVFMHDIEMYSRVTKYNKQVVVSRATGCNYTDQPHLFHKLVTSNDLTLDNEEETYDFVILSNTGGESCGFMWEIECSRESFTYGSSAMVTVEFPPTGQATVKVHHELEIPRGNASDFVCSILGSK